jgi:hypothetical protein
MYHRIGEKVFAVKKILEVHHLSQNKFFTFEKQHSVFIRYKELDVNVYGGHSLAAWGKLTHSKDYEFMLSEEECIKHCEEIVAKMSFRTMKEVMKRSDYDDAYETWIKETKGR